MVAVSRLQTAARRGGVRSARAIGGCAIAMRFDTVPHWCLRAAADATVIIMSFVVKTTYEVPCAARQ